MARYRNNYRYNNTRSNQAALQHIEDAKRLTKELGGTDQDVKKWFFNLTSNELDPILKEYKERYGQKPYDYALDTLPKWKSGKTKMSGTVAERLFNLLPDFMPLEHKYKLVDSLWQHVGPSKKRLVEAGSDADIDEVIKVVNDEVISLATRWEIPEALNNRFNWLKGADSNVYQKLLSHIKDSERELAIKVLNEQLPILKENFVNNWQDVSSNVNYIIEVGKQSVEVRLIADKASVVAKDWSPIPYHNSSYKGTFASNFSISTLLTWCFWIFVLYLIFK